MQRGRKPPGRRSKGRKGAKASTRQSVMREVMEIPRISAEEIHRTLVETMAGVLRGRIEPDEALVIGMVAEEQLRMLQDEKKREKRPVN